MCLYCREPCESDLFSAEPMWSCAWCQAVCHVRCHETAHQPSVTASTPLDISATCSGELTANASAAPERVTPTEPGSLKKRCPTCFVAEGVQGAALHSWLQRTILRSCGLADLKCMCWAGNISLEPRALVQRRGGAMGQALLQTRAVRWEWAGCCRLSLGTTA